MISREKAKHFNKKKIRIVIKTKSFKLYQYCICDLVNCYGVILLSNFIFISRNNLNDNKIRKIS